MWPFDLFKRKKEGLYPERLWTVSIADGLITGTDQTGAKMAVALSELKTVAIETNDSGPWGADVIWLLFEAEAKLALAFPQGATGEAEVVDVLLELPGFDQAEMIKAMGCTSNAVFLVWERR